jgi:hypothetical protein
MHYCLYTELSLVWACEVSFTQLRPVGRCVILTALSVLLTCWPPAPLARFVSTFKSLSCRTMSTYKETASVKCEAQKLQYRNTSAIKCGIQLKSILTEWYIYNQLHSLFIRVTASYITKQFYIRTWKFHQTLKQNNNNVMLVLSECSNRNDYNGLAM